MRSTNKYVMVPYFVDGKLIGSVKRKAGRRLVVRLDQPLKGWLLWSREASFKGLRGPDGQFQTVVERDGPITLVRAERVLVVILKAGSRIITITFRRGVPRVTYENHMP